jgi:hypothetical protein
MVLLDGMIRTRRLTEFIQETMKIRNEELIDKTRWEFWLHKVFDMSFDDYLSRLGGNKETEEVLPAEALEATVKDSIGILKGFCPS